MIEQEEKILIKHKKTDFAHRKRYSKTVRFFFHENQKTVGTRRSIDNSGNQQPTWTSGKESKLSLI